MRKHNEVGRMRWRVSMLSLLEEPDGCRWRKTGARWAEVSWPGKSNLFSKVGLGARSARVRLRRVEGLSLHDALSIDGQHLFLTAIDEDETGLYQICEAAAVTPVPCTITRRQTRRDNAFNRPQLTETGSYTFPACLTEKYVRLTEVTPQDMTETCFVLVTPKCVQLRAGELVTVGETPMRVQTAHTLDAYKNEYEVYREGDT